MREQGLPWDDEAKWWTELLAVGPGLDVLGTRPMVAGAYMKSFVFWFLTAREVQLHSFFAVGFVLLSIWVCEPDFVCVRTCVLAYKNLHAL